MPIGMNEPRWTEEIPIKPGWYWMRERHHATRDVGRRIYMGARLVQVRIVTETDGTRAEWLDYDGWRVNNTREGWRRLIDFWRHPAGCLFWPIEVTEPPDDLHLGVPSPFHADAPRSASRSVTPLGLYQQLKRMLGFD